MTSEEIANREDEITLNASLLGELRAADFIARLIGVADEPELPAGAIASHRRRRRRRAPAAV